MIAALIRWSIVNRLLVLLATVAVTSWGIYSVRDTPLDALPDLSDVQVIIRTSYPGQAPQIVENQVTYPLTTTMLSVPGAKTVRGYSFFGDSFVYILFEDGTDPYWARSRVLEYMNQVQSRLPAQARPALGPDASGVGWVYEYALVDRSGRMDLGQLRSLQDWFLKYELKTVANVAEVVLPRAVNQRILVNPAHAGGVGTQRGLGRGRQARLHLRKIFQHTRTRPIRVGAVLEQDVDERIAKERIATHGLRARHRHHRGRERVSHLVLHNPRRLSGKRRADDDLHIRQIGNCIERRA